MKTIKDILSKGHKTYFEWKFKGFGIFLGCSESLSIVFSPLLKQVCLILFSVILFSSVCWDLNEEKGRRGEGREIVVYPLFLLSLVWHKLAALLWAVRVTPSVTLCKAAEEQITVQTTSTSTSVPLWHENVDEPSTDLCKSLKMKTRWFKASNKIQSAENS